jgi:lysophospholipase L1-like esterase
MEQGERMLVSRRPVVLTLAVTAAMLAAASTACSSSSSEEGSAGSGSGGGNSQTSPSQEAGEGGEGELETEQQAAPEFMWDTSPSSIAAIGDSITRGFDTCGLLTDCPEASWATGTDAEVESLAAQLLGDNTSGRSWNLAETGASVADLSAQARRAASHDPQLVTVLIGANDACASDVESMTSAADFEEDFAEAMDVLRTESPQTQIYVSSVPDLMRLWQEGSESMMARTVWGMANLCPSMLADAGNRSAGADARREAVRERVQEYNQALAEVCASDELCRYDGGAVFDFEFTSNHLSEWDWFHPGEQGQRELAALAYDQVVADVTTTD